MPDSEKTVSLQDLRIESYEVCHNHRGYYRFGSYLFPYELTYPSKNDRTHRLKNPTRFPKTVLTAYGL